MKRDYAHAILESYLKNITLSDALERDFFADKNRKAFEIEILPKDR